jgi:hypothetical protein
MHHNFLKWFSGKSLEKAKVAVELMEQSIAQDSWIPGASRKCRAAFNKTNVANKLLSPLREGSHNLLEHLGAPEGEQYRPQYRKIAHMGWQISFMLSFGHFDNKHSADIDFEACRTAANEDDLLLKAINGAEQAVKDFAEVYELMDRFDVMRPKPVFTNMGASLLVSQTMKSMDAVTVEVCPIEWFVVEYKNEKGQTCYKQVGRLKWPEGTLHQTSPKGYAGSNCEACGHAIRNGLNWVPLVITTNKNEKKSLWVGKDCCKTLFGIDMKGDLELVEASSKFWSLFK